MTRLRLAALAAAAVAALAACTPTPDPAPDPTASATDPATAVTSAPDPTDPADYPLSLETWPTMDGSTATIPLAELALQRLAGLDPVDAANFVDFHTTPTAYQYLSQQAVDLLLAYEPDEATRASVAQLGVTLEYHPIGRDALVFLTHASNPVESLTGAQLRGIYQANPAIANWSQVGGEDQPILAYQRPPTSGSQALMVSLVMGPTPLADAPTMVAMEMASLVDAVAQYSNDGTALGYSVYYYVANMYAVADIKLLAVDGVAPSNESIADGTYPYTNDFYAVVRADEPEGSPARQVVAWLESADGQAAVTEAGYVALNP